MTWKWITTPLQNPAARLERWQAILPRLHSVGLKLMVEEQIEDLRKELAAMEPASNVRQFDPNRSRNAATEPGIRHLPE